MYLCKLVVCINATSLEYDKYKSAEDKPADGKFQSAIIRKWDIQLKDDITKHNS